MIRSSCVACAGVAGKSCVRQAIKVAKTTSRFFKMPPVRVDVLLLSYGACRVHLNSSNESDLGTHWYYTDDLVRSVELLDGALDIKKLCLDETRLLRGANV